MANCPHCGAVTNPGASFCNACGTSLLPPATGAYTGAVTGTVPRSVRPVGVTIVGVVLMLLGGFTVLAAVASLLFFGAFGAMFPFWWAGLGGMMSALALIGFLFLAGTAALAIATGMGVLRGKEWAWVTTLIVMGLIALQGFAQIVQTRSTDGVIAVLVAAGVMTYFFRPEVKAWFGKG